MNMLTKQLVEKQLKVRVTHLNPLEVNRLLAAAVVSRQFCSLLLTDPAKAIADGFAGEHFSFSEEEFALMLSLRGTTLPELAQQLCKYLPEAKPATRTGISENYQVRI